MKGFFKTFFASFLAIIVSTIVLVILFFAIISAIMASQDKAAEVKPNSILVLKLNQPIVDRKPALPFDIRTLSRTSRMGLNDILDNIKKAKTDPNIDGIHLKVKFIPAGMATIEEIRNALLDFRSSGKFVTVYSEVYAQSAYYLASAADEVYYHPSGFMEFVGLRSQSPFFKGALEKLDVEATVIRHGKYKSAGERFSETGYSSESREAMSRLIQTFWSKIRADIGEQRNIGSEKLNQMAESLAVSSPSAALQLGMVDSVLYEDQVLEILKQKTGRGDSEKLRTIGLNKYSTVPAKRSYKGLARDKIAVVYASGEIRDGEADENIIGAEHFVKEIRKARRDSSIKAIVLRVNSPGGGSIASDVLWRELYLARQAKPLVVSMGDLAASGGYYISCMADTIYAQATTITGSIGVIGLYMNTKGMFNKIGVSWDTEKTNTYSDFLSGVRAASPFELNYWQATVDSMYATFVRRVSDGRNMTYSQVDAIAQGRVWSGIDALELGLVDKIGGLNDAIETARTMAGLSEKYRIVELPKQDEPFEMIMKDLTQGAQMKILEHRLGIHGEYLHSFLDAFENQGFMARIPYDISIY